MPIFVSHNFQDAAVFSALSLALEAADLDRWDSSSMSLGDSLRIPVMLSSYSIRSCPPVPGMLSTPSERSDAGC